MASMTILTGGGHASVGGEGESQVTLRQTVLDHLGVKPGKILAVWLLPDSRVELVPASAVHELKILPTAWCAPKRGGRDAATS